MSYTMMDWLRDSGLPDDERYELVERMIEDDRVIVRRADLDALVDFAAQRLNVDDEAAWKDDDDAPVLMAISNWHKERIEWT